MGRGTVRSLVEAKEGGGAPAARSSLALHHPSDGPPPHSLGERGGDTDCYPSADCQHIPPRQRTDFLRFSIKSASPARHSWGLWETHPVPSQGRLARPAIRSGGGSGWSGISLCNRGSRTAIGGLLRARRPGWRAGGDTQAVPGIGTSPDLPVGGAAVRPEHGHPTQASGKLSARSVLSSSKRYFCLLIRAKARALRHASRTRLETGGEESWVIGDWWLVIAAPLAAEGRRTQRRHTSAGQPPTTNHQPPTTNPQNHRKTACPKPVHPVPTPGQRCHPANAPG